ncbi:MAG: hypothetical protein AABW83_00385 [Nanoarchaeota archaeon]
MVNIGIIENKYNEKTLIQRLIERDKIEYIDENKLKLDIICKFLPRDYGCYYKILDKLKLFIFNEKMIFSRDYTRGDLASKLVEEGLAYDLEDGLKLVPELVEFIAFKKELNDSDNYYKYRFCQIKNNGDLIKYYAIGNEFLENI